MPVRGILGRKVGMTQIFAPDGTLVPVTVVEAGPCLVVQRKTPDKDGYVAVQIGLVESRPDRRANRARKGHFDRAGVAPMRNVAEVALDGDDELKPGDKVLCDTFKEKDHVDVIGVSKGKGFQGPVHLHHFTRGPKSHGSDHLRRQGSVGSGTTPGRVLKGLRMAAHQGADKVTVRNLEILRSDPARSLLVIAGAVPGGKNGIVMVRKA